MSVYHIVYDIVLQIPRGRVTTYGKISEHMSRRISAQAVGWALRALPDDASKAKKGTTYHSKSVPWHRVINSRGTVSTRGLDISQGLQQRLLEAEGVVFDEAGVVDLSEFLWDPAQEKAAASQRQQRKEKQKTQQTKQKPEKTKNTKDPKQTEKIRKVKSAQADHKLQSQDPQKPSKERKQKRPTQVLLAPFFVLWLLLTATPALFAQANPTSAPANQPSTSSINTIQAVLDQVGLQVEPAGKLSKVIAIRPNSQAARAGLEVGDQLLSTTFATNQLTITLKRSGLRFTKSLNLGGNEDGSDDEEDEAGMQPNGTESSSGGPNKPATDLQAQTSGTAESRLSRPGNAIVAKPPNGSPFTLSATTYGAAGGLVNPQAFQAGTAQPDSLLRPPLDLHAMQNGTPMMNVAQQPVPFINAPMEIKILSQYNIELIVDRSMSMRHRDCPWGLSRWEWCGRQAQDLSNAIAPYVPNGLTIVPFGGTFEVYPRSSPQDIANLFHFGALQCGTRLCEPLTARLNSYFAVRNALTKPLLIAVITDGIPFPPPEPEMVREELVRATAMMTNSQEVTVVFFQIGGKDKFGHAYLKSLDTDLVHQGARFHYVHMIPFEQLEQIGLAQALAQVVSGHQSNSGWKFW